ncbi:MAG: family 78 glycoside hydrolase catalytic domain [Bacteroidales bacterium]|nr:family 78 glycoside hydrolase catalytic domain [Bacteroidales bacterium]
MIVTLKKTTTIVFFLLALAHAYPQAFIGCKVGNQWVETPLLRKTFLVTEDDLRQDNNQKVYFDVDIVSLGYHELYVNGTKVGDKVLQPAVSQLNKRAFETTHNITDLIHKGKNEIMIWVGQGWGRVYGTHALAKATVTQTVSDRECGLIYTVTQTDNSWEASPSGYSYTGSWQPMQFGGERCDARVQPDWRPASISNHDDINITRQEYLGNKIIDTISYIKYDTEPDNALVIDFGRVITGWFSAVFKPMATNTEVSIEYLDHRDAKPPFTETDFYVSDGKKHDSFCNKFHTHSFRYVRIKGAELSEAKALQISAVNPSEGATFECSDPRLNAIHDMVKYTLSRLTFSGYMVDCPHIERMGYGGDGNSSTMTLQTFWDVRDTYRNWLTAWGDAMDSTGDLPYVAPAFRTGGGPYWSGFIIKAPWRTYLNYGDRSLINENWSQMKLWLEFVKSYSPDGLLQRWPDTERRNWFLGDWAAPEGVDIKGESALFVSNCFIAECLGDMVRMTDYYSRKNDSAYYASWRERLVKDIHRNFYHPETHTYANGTVLDQCYALLMGIPPDSATAQAVKEQLVKDCHGKYRDHIAVGLVGVPIFTEWCIRERQANLMATILRQPDYPGYLNMINNGATTTWESWDCGRPGKEDRSRVHNCYNGIGIWFYQALAGIRPDRDNPGYEHFFIDPQTIDGIEWIHATKPTPYGVIKVDIEGKNMKVSVPEGSTATIFPDSRYERTVSAGEWHFTINDKWTHYNFKR